MKSSYTAIACLMVAWPLQAASAMAQQSDEARESAQAQELAEASEVDQPIEVEWRVKDRFRLFAGADAEAAAAVDTLMDKLAANPDAPLETFYDDYLAVLSDRETGYRRSEILRNANFGPNPSNKDGPGRYDPDYLYPQSYQIELTVAAAGDEQCSYTTALASVSGRCDDWTAISVPAGDGRRSFAGARGLVTVSRDTGWNAQVQYDFKDLAVVALGDSYISGEGNPDVPSRIDAPLNKRFMSRASWGSAIKPEHLAQEAIWWDRSCHRSLLSWPVLSSLAFAARDDRQAITLVHLGCSGAVSDEVIDKKTPKLPGGGSEPESQLVQLKTLLDAQPEGSDRREIDKVLLSLGGNDVAFADVLATLALPPNGYLIDFLFPRLVGKSAGAVCPYDRSGIPLARLCESKDSAQTELADLPSSYSKLTEALAAIGIAKSKVFHAQYPNPLICSGGNPCDNNPANDQPPSGQYEGTHGFDALMGIIPKFFRGWRYDPWGFEIHYLPEGDDTDLLYPELPLTQCDDTPEKTDSEVCQAMWVHYRLNRAVADSGFRQITGHLGKIRGHGLTDIGDGPDLVLPLARDGRWITEKTPENFDPYARVENGRWFRIPNDSILMQYHFSTNGRHFHQGTAHPTYRAHLEYAQATLDEAFE